MAPLVTLADYQTAVGSTANPTRQQLAIDDATQAVLNYTDRDFGAATARATKTYKYDGKGILEIDDCSAVHSVNGLTVPVFNWVAMREGPAVITVYSWLRLPPLKIVSGEMGFARNMDVFLRRYPTIPGVFLTDVEVDADFGWPTVPNDVRRATIFTAQEYERASASDSSGDIASKTVAEVSESYFQAMALQQQSAIEGLPGRAADILWPYKRHSL